MQQVNSITALDVIQSDHGTFVYAVGGVSRVGFHNIQLIEWAHRDADIKLGIACFDLSGDFTEVAPITLEQSVSAARKVCSDPKDYFGEGKPLKTIRVYSRTGYADKAIKG